jgi:hypothetical protein
MKTTDLFKINRTSKRLNESMYKTFGRKLNLEAFNIEQLEDARNKLRTQIYTARSNSSFNENVENDALAEAQWMHDAIVAELAERDVSIVDNTVEEGGNFDEQELSDVLKAFDETMNERGGYGDPDYNKIMSALDNRDIESAIDEVWNAYSDQDGGEIDMHDAIKDLEDEFKFLVYSNPVGRVRPNQESVGEEAPPTAKGERMVKHIKQGYAQDGKLTDKEKGIAYATAWKDHNKNESINTGEDMRNLREGEIQQASAIVTAKTMVDRVGRWIEELSGMENDTLLQLGDSIRDEMGQEQAKAFIEAVAPAIQSALETLKGTRDTLSTGVRSLASGEQPTDMLGAEAPAGDEMGAVEPDAMNLGDELGGDEFAAAEPAAGGSEEAGREMRESISRQNRLLKVLAG